MGRKAGDEGGRAGRGCSAEKERTKTSGNGVSFHIGGKKSRGSLKWHLHGWYHAWTSGSFSGCTIEKLGQLNHTGCAPGGVAAHSGEKKN